MKSSSKTDEDKNLTQKLVNSKKMNDICWFQKLFRVSTALPPILCWSFFEIKIYDDDFTDSILKWNRKKIYLSTLPIFVA